ncbi:hypothetical protein B0G75_12421 [Paraburkholderia sp. BL18I3N2]|uniref:hypothetical protein n=1 Tax=unclassified Paraburkholderia TaxID=2615204 RepID=UPI000D05B5E7|nr:MULTISPECIES: hypothetical protein [unclassified Paraburkholderia]PRX23978.1 hypothetical protein B0G75_12421 [Paraburkholderia sp. BL18I3N2]PRX95956.1 hypothetical protein B0G73_13165 [Paraburkholderia sp. BL25I1N1]
MISNRYRLLAAALVLDGYAVTAAVAASQWWRHQPGAGGQFAALMVPMSFYLIARLVREGSGWVLLPPALVLMWLGAVAASPFCLLGLAVRNTWGAWR